MEQFWSRTKVAIPFSVVYIGLINLTMEWRPDHSFFIIFVTACLILHRRTHHLVFILSAFILFWISYDFMRLYPNYLVNDVHVEDLYMMEVKWFGVYNHGSKEILSEWFASRKYVMLTVIAGISYLLWVPGPMAYTWVLSKKAPRQMILFSYAFLLTNFIGFIIYYLYPAAPPWYYMNYGNGTDFTIPGSEAMLAHFDEIINFPLFNGIYAKNANVFAAVPSLHAAYPVVGLFFALKFNHRFWIWFFSFLTVGIWFAAVYSQHHYIIDLLLGLVCAVVAYFAMIRISRTTAYTRFENWMISRLEA